MTYNNKHYHSNNIKYKAVINIYNIFFHFVIISHDGNFIPTLFAKYRSHDKNWEFLYEVGEIFILKKIYRVWLTFQTITLNLSYEIVTYCKAYSSIIFCCYLAIPAIHMIKIKSPLKHNQLTVVYWMSSLQSPVHVPNRFHDDFQEIHD